MNSTFRSLSLAAAVSMTAACSFHSTATKWNGRIGDDGNPVFVKTSTNIGFNLGIIIPLLGNTSMETMVDNITKAVADEGGDRVRVVQSGSENYWYGWSPFTWILTPVVTDIAVEYEPSPAEIQRVMAEQAAFKRRQSDRRKRDNSHVVPNANDRR